MIYPDFQHAYLAEMLRRMDESETMRSELIAKAHALIALWRGHKVDPWICNTWATLLEKPTAEILATAFARTDDGERLRHSIPFAGILTNLEYQEIRAPYKKITH